MELLSNLIQSLKKQGYTTLVNIITSEDEFDDMEELFLGKMVSGGIFMGFPHGTHQIYQIANKYNTVFVDQFFPSEDIHQNMKLINCDNEIGGYEATKYLIECGHQDILHIEGDGRLSSIERKQGYLRALKEFDIRKEDIICGMYREDVTYEEMKKRLKQGCPTAIFAANDIMSLGAVRALEEQGIRIPEDVSIVGFDNLKVAHWRNMKLTTFEVSLKTIAKECVRILLQEKTEHKIEKPHLIKKNSVKEFGKKE